MSILGQRLHTGPLLLLNQLWRIIVKALTVMLVIFPRSLRPASNKKPHELHATAYLDALRGYAAWIVYNDHTIPAKWRPETSGPFMNHSCFQIFFRGFAMVDIFFVISGFALTWQVLGYMHDNQPARILDSITSSLFRRHLRLYLPLTFASFITMIALYTGIAIQGDGPGVLQPTLLGNLQFWVADTVRSWDPFTLVVSWWTRAVRITHTSYVPQAWTIPVEFRGSIIIFTYCIAVCKLTTRTRMRVTLAGTAMCMWWMSPYVALFLFGMWLADCRHLRTRQQRDAPPDLPLVQTTPPSELEALGDEIKREDDVATETTSSTGDYLESSGFRPLIQRLGSNLSPPLSPGEPTLLQQSPYIALALLALIPLTPEVIMAEDSPFPYNWLVWTHPPGYYLNGRARLHWPYSIGAMMLCYALEHAPLLQKPLRTQFSQFIGELSFGIYVMHNLVRWIVWNRYFYVWGIAWFGKLPRHQVPGYIVMTVLVIWAAELFRIVDVKCVRLTKILQDRVFVKNG